MRSASSRNQVIIALLLLAAAVGIAQLLARGGSQIPLPGSRAGSQPALSNAEFWGMVTDFSEPGGKFFADNLASNEVSVGHVASELHARGKTGGAFLGVGPEQNFTYIAATKPDIAFIIDIRRLAMLQHLMYKAVFELSSNRDEFIALLFSKPPQPRDPNDSALTVVWARYLPVPSDSVLYRSNLAAILDHLVKVRHFALTPNDSAGITDVYRTFYRAGPFISFATRARVDSERVQYTLSAPTFVSLTLATDLESFARSFLATESSYRLVREMHSRNLIIPVVGDFGGPHALQRIGEWLHAHHMVVSAFYTSNVEQYLFSPLTKGALPTWKEFYANVRALPLDESSIFIRPFAINIDSDKVFGLLSILPLPADPPAGFVSRPRRLVGSTTQPKRSASSEAIGVGGQAVCGMVDFLVSVAAGKVGGYSDVTKCVK